ncbi:hypothetical protein GR210_12420 [Rhizobium leguminosarum]|uniref:hypothetical protein n=1 Tax=Rhizobium leguminosarum TaxID=384 RepID=UPI0013D9BF2A|nr:hypothetical protein [Rhizobium leguminosarum]NEH49587.1 hypothetical protein [Rhizobium leguminosarum]
MRISRLIIAVVIWPITLESTSATSLQLTAVPSEAANSIKIAEPYGDKVLAQSPPTSGITADVTLYSENPTRSVFAIWSDGTQTAFPLLLSTVFANKAVEVHLDKFAFNGSPEFAATFDHCLSIQPSSVTMAFEMYHWCKSAALAAEKANKKWDKVHRGALQGWLRANYFLFQRSAPVSPYALDSDLISRLTEINAKEASEKWGASRWGPLKLEDVSLLLAAARTSEVRLVGLIPDLLKQGMFKEALQINQSAASTLSQSGAKAAYGVSAKVLEGNKAYIETLQRGTNSN